MLRWLRSVGDAFRIDEEMRRINLPVSSFPAEFRRELKVAVQNHIDRAQRSDAVSPLHFDAFCNTAYRWAAAFPAVMILPAPIASTLIGQDLYVRLSGLAGTSRSSIESDLAKDLFATCKRWIQQPRQDFLEMVEARAAMERVVGDNWELDEDEDISGEVDDESDSHPDPDPDREWDDETLVALGDGEEDSFEYESFEDWLDDFKEGAAQTNELLQTTEKGCLIDFMDLSPLRRAYQAEVDPIQLGREFGESFDFGTFFGPKA